MDNTVKKNVMKKIFLFFSFLLTIMACAQKNNNAVEKIVNPTINDKLVVTSFGCQYLDSDVYIINNNFVVYEGCSTRKIIYPDFKTFHLPKHNERGFFAIDKDGIYFRGEKIKTDTTGFKIVGINNNYENPEVLWKTKNAIYKNTEKITVSDVATFEAIECLNGHYFKDKNFVYYFDKKIEGSDGSSVNKSCNEFTYDKNNAYLNGKIVTHQNEKVTPINEVFYKTSKNVFTRYQDNFTIFPEIDVETIKKLSDSYSVDKNHAYYGTAKLPVKKENLKNIKVWEQVNRAYLSDGVKVYSREDDLPNNFDAKTFGMLPHSDFCYDKNGVYERQWIEEKEEVIYYKFPFNYKNPVSDKNMFITDDSRYIIYENQAYDPWDKKIYKNLTNEQITLAKENKLRLDKVEGNNEVKIDKEFDYLLYKANNKIYWDGKETIADAKTFAPISLYNIIYKDAKNVYLYNRGLGLLIIEGMNGETLSFFNGFIKDDKFIYQNTQKIIKSKDIELLAIFTGYRMGCSQDTHPGSNFYLFKNFEGYWLVEISNKVTIRNLGKTLPNQKEWAPNLKDTFQIK